MRDLDFAGLRTVAEDAAKQPEFAAVQGRARRIVRRRTAVVGAAAALLVAAVGTSVVVAGQVDSRPDAADASPGGPFPSPGVPPSGFARSLIQSAAAADADHLYAVLDPDACHRISESCTRYLYASDDGGHTWQRRSPLPENWSMFVDALAPGVLLMSSKEGMVAGDPISGSLALHLSTDGGRTWSDTALADEPIAAVPSGQRARVCPLETDKVCAYDSAARRLAPLATQPPFHLVSVVDAPASTGVWVTGYDLATRKPALAISRDGGRTWLTHVFTDGTPPPEDRIIDGHVPAGWAPAVATTDGRTAYAVLSDEHDNKRVYRSTDGGATWPFLLEGKGKPWPFVFVTPDGGHVTLEQAYPGFVPWMSRDGGAYVRTEFVGLPPFGILPRLLDGGGFLTWTEDRIYRSSNGLAWEPLD